MKKALAIAVVLFSVVMSSLFIKHSMTEDWKYNVNGNYDDSFNLINYEVSTRDTVELYALEESEADILMILSICLSVSSITYVLITYKKSTKSTQLDLLNQENDLLKKQIENNELKQRLKDIKPTDANISNINQSADSEQNNNPTIQEQNYVLCPKCSTVNDTKYSFCSQCGHSFAITQASKAESKGKYISGVLIAIIWSTILSLLTIIFYAIKDMADVDKIASNAVQGVLARPIVVLLIALIFSSFFNPKDKKINKFNTSTKYLMGILTIGEVGRWFVILGA